MEAQHAVFAEKSGPFGVLESGGIAMNYMQALRPAHGSA